MRGVMTALLPLAAGCIINVGQLPCVDDEWCPTGQHCGADKLCVAGGPHDRCPKPTLTAATRSGRQIDLGWSDCADEFAWILERRAPGGEFVQLVKLGADQTQHPDRAVDPETTYTYRVRAQNGAGDSPTSEDASAATWCDPGTTRPCPGAKGICADGHETCEAHPGAASSWGTCSATAQTETCNGLDDDCDGKTDADDDNLVLAPCEIARGVCAGSVHARSQCSGAHWTDCGAAEYGAEFEVSETKCDGKDNDCDGATDNVIGTSERLSRACWTGEASQRGRGICRDGVQQCAGTGPDEWEGCQQQVPPAEERCDGLDDDCDGVTDEDESGQRLAQACWTGDASKQGIGICHDGTKRCASTGSNVWESCTGETVPSTETCNALDDDCDGRTDEDASGERMIRICWTGEASQRHKGICRDGWQACVSTGPDQWGACTDQTLPAPETCDGLDDDCDGLTDAADADLVLVACEKTQGVCAGAVHSATQCNGTSTWEACTAAEYGAMYQTAESACDGLDNDCNGTTDENPAGAQLSRGCLGAKGICAGGTRTCTALAGSAVEAWSECSVQAQGEVCNGLDDDCDGDTDAADPDLVLAACEKNAGVCAGRHHAASQCHGDSTWDACTAAEYGAMYQATESACDGLDNDCNGTKDENPAGAQLSRGCPGARGICAGGTEVCDALAGSGVEDWSECSVQAQDEVCNGLDDDCDGDTDAADPNLVLAACEKSVGVCVGAIHARSQCRGVATWDSCTAAQYGALYQSTETVCDGLDNDCDGATDPGCAPTCDGGSCGGPDGGMADGGIPDAGPGDGGTPDGGYPDGGLADGGTPGGGSPDAGASDYCGRVGEPCCDGSTCNSGFACSTGTCQRPAICRPDGRLVYTSGDKTIRILDLATGVESTVPLPYSQYSAVWAPSWGRGGGYIAFNASPPACCNAQVWVARPDGTDLRRISDGSGDTGNPHFSAAGDMVAFNQVAGVRVYTINFDSSNLVQHSVSFSWPRLSPDASSILGANWGASPVDLFVYGVSAHTTVNLTNATGSARFIAPAWSPDGTQIALQWQAASGAQWDVVVMRRDGSDRRNLTDDWSDSVEGNPAWTPEGKCLLFTSNRGAGSLSHIWSMFPDGTGRVQLTSGSAGETEPDVTLDMVSVSAGPFWRGCNVASPETCASDAVPYREITLGAFEIDRMPVTQAAYKACVDVGRCRTPAGFDPASQPAHAVGNIQWGDAKTYCEWVGKRLPTEAEWEKAARGTDGRRYPWGSQAIDPSLACCRTCSGCPRAVGSFPDASSPYGMLDVLGTVWQWVADWYDESYYASASATDPQGLIAGTQHVNRGKGYGSDLFYSGQGVWDRVANAGSTTYGDFGFRCARSVPSWNSAACGQKGGYWAALNDGSTDSGCWFFGAAGQSCSTVCAGRSLSCVPRNWNDDASDTVCKHIAPSNALYEPRDPTSPECGPTWYSGYGGICGRIPPGHGNQSCECIPTDWNRFCVCAP